jgi:DNA helicase II / ATP-dependent DNA helicase PcrA
MFDRSSLNPQQRLAVETLHGPMLILAGAGTGKTRVITCRIAHMIQHGIPAGRILAVTFTNKAAREMQERVRAMLPRNQAARGESWPERPTICTFHSLGVRILRQHIDRLGYKRNFVIYDEAEQLSTVRRVLSHISPGTVKIDPAAVLAFLSRYRNAGPQGARVGDEAAAALAERIRGRYESALRACNAVDFDDLLLLTLRLLHDHADVLEQCRERFRYVMVDEYQDTNAAQFRLVHLLTQEHRNVCVVGDDDQSIYGWRGAEIANLLDLEKHFPEVKVVKLEQNYRSTNTILAAANAIIRNNVRRREKRLWSQKGQGTRLQLHVFADDDDEARSIVEEIGFARQAKRIPWSQHAILFRTNGQSRPFETALRQAGVRYHLVGGQSFFDRREIRDVLAYLKAFVNPHDDVSLLRIANVPARGLSDVTMERLLAASHERRLSVFGAMQDAGVRLGFPARARESIEDFVRLVTVTREELTGATDLSLCRWAERFLTAIGYEQELRRQEKDAEAAESRIRSLRELVASLESGEPRGGDAGHRLAGFLEDLALDADREEDTESDQDAVTLITMHSCKGLEFPHVFIVGLEDGLLPHSRSKAEGTLDEERRLFYVSLTRAMQTLTLSYCSARRRYGQLMPCHPSPFLKELPPELVELADEKARQPVPVAAGASFFAAMRSALD